MISEEDGGVESFKERSEVPVGLTMTRETKKSNSRLAVSSAKSEPPSPTYHSSLKSLPMPMTPDHGRHGTQKHDSF